MLQRAYGLPLGFSDGTELGLRLGTREGVRLGLPLGFSDGFELGLRLGTREGVRLGLPLGFSDGFGFPLAALGRATNKVTRMLSKSFIIGMFAFFWVD